MPASEPGATTWRAQSPADHRVGQGEQRQRQRGEVQHLLAEEELGADEQAEAERRSAAIWRAVWTRVSLITHHTIGGTSHWAVMCRWLLDCEIMPGAKPANGPPTQRRAAVEPERAGEQQVPAGGGGGQVDAPSRTANVRATPNSTVTGAKSTPCGCARRCSSG